MAIKKSRYFVDTSNRLVIKRNRKSLLTDGRFSIDKANRLIYWLNEPLAWRRQYDLPNKINFIGNWKLNPNYDLELNLQETPDQHKGDHLVLKGEIISTDRDTLAFEIITHKQGLSPKGTVPESTHIQLLKLTGSWQADAYNRISFLVKKKTSPDILTLGASWQLNPNQQIIYTYEKADLKTKTKTSQVITFEGFWQINSANKLTYILSHSSNSRFDFRVQIESPNIYPQEGVIKYRLGIGLRDDKTYQTKITSLYGTWKFNRKLGLLFQMDYGRGNIHNIEFGTNIHLTKKDEVIFALANKHNKPLGFRITFTHRFLKKLDAETFLRLKRLQEEKTIETGISIPF